MKNLFLVLFSMILLYVSWYVDQFLISVFIAFVPILLLNISTRSNLEGILMSYLTLVGSHFLLFNWILQASFSGFLLVCLIDSILYTIPFIIFNVTYRKIGRIIAVTFFIASWLSIEHLQISNPWGFPLFNLGYILAKNSSIIQFYEITGYSGGSLWILVTNVAVFLLIARKDRQMVIKPLITCIFIFMVPLSYNLIKDRDDSISAIDKEISFLIIQTDVDCRKEKYKKSSEELTRQYVDQTKRYLGQFSSDLLIVWPETAVTNFSTVEYLDVNPSSEIIFNELLAENPDFYLLTGGISYENLGQFYNQRKDANVKYLSGSKSWYRTYNTAVQLNYNISTVFRTKKHLVPIEETIPVSAAFSFIRNIVSSQGDFFFSYLKTGYKFVVDGVQYLPLICYEVLFPNFIRNKVLEGAEFLVVVANEGWFKDISGSKQFINALKANAISTRRQAIKSSNDGLICHISEFGEILGISQSLTPGAISGKVKSNSSTTFYTEYGDLINYLAYFYLGICFAILATKKLLIRK